MKYDVVIIGGSLGGLRAAISSLDKGLKVYMSERTDWVGGQLTSQCIPPDENRWIESQGAPRSYIEYRKKVRNYYRNLPNASENMKKECFCPGNSWVSRIAHSPKLAHDILEEEIKKYLDNKQLTLDLNTVIDSADYTDDVINSVTLKNIITNEKKTVSGKFYLDGTDSGDLLPLVKCEYTLGRESKAETGEKDATEDSDEFDLQSCTWVACLKLKKKLEKEDYIEKPLHYEHFKNKKTRYCNLNLFGWTQVDAHNLKPIYFPFYDEKGGGFFDCGYWSFRRIVAKENYTTDVDEVSLINWPMNDYDEGPVFGREDSEYHRMMAREQTLSFIYWLQNDAPNPNGGFGYPVTIAPEYTGTKDGLAKEIYIRESRRIKGIETVKEEDVSRFFTKSIKVYNNSVGVGHYAMDVHLTLSKHTMFYSPTNPFEIPLGAMIPIRMKNLIPACKNISLTHFTNGCYRLHPIEWTVGEVAGLLAYFAIEKNCSLKDVNDKYYDEFKNILIDYGEQLHWDEKEIDLVNLNVD